MNLDFKKHIENEINNKINTAPNKLIRALYKIQIIAGQSK